MSVVYVVVINYKNRKIKICSEIINIMHNYIQETDSDTEAGGIIVGRENLGNSNLILEYATKPMKNDLRTRTRFIRKDSGHVDYYKQLYSKYNGIYAYYGEWHTHPEDTPHYSIIDLNNWRKISKDDPKNMQYHIIVGRKRIRIWEMKRRCLAPRLIGEVKWNDIFF